MGMLLLTVHLNLKLNDVEGQGCCNWASKRRCLTGGSDVHCAITSPCEACHVVLTWRQNAFMNT